MLNSVIKSIIIIIIIIIITKVPPEQATRCFTIAT